VTETLVSKTKGRVLIPRLKTATSFPSRAVGLISRSSLPDDEAMYFPWSSSIHTCFMRFAIDCVFVDRQMRIKTIYHGVRPWRLAWPVGRGVFGVIEMASGNAERLGLQVGEELHVGA